MNARSPVSCGEVGAPIGTAPANLFLKALTPPALEDVVSSSCCWLEALAPVYDGLTRWPVVAGETAGGVDSLAPDSARSLAFFSAQIWAGDLLLPVLLIAPTWTGGGTLGVAPNPPGVSGFVP